MEHFKLSFTKERWVLLHKDLSCVILFTWVCLLTSNFNESWYFYYHAVHSIGFNTLLHLIINKVQRYPPLSHTDLPAKHSFETSSYLKLFFMVWINTVLAVDAFMLLQWRPSPRRLLLLLTFLMSKQALLARTPTDILRLCCSWSSWKLPPFPGFPVATEKSPCLYFLIPQGPCCSHLFHVLGHAGPGFNARLISRVVQMAGIQPVLLPDVRHMPWTRSWNYFYFLLLFSINFQWIRFPDLVCSIALLRAGFGKIEEWCSMAWGQIRWYRMLGCFCGLSFAGLGWAPISDQ